MKLTFRPTAANLTFPKQNGSKSGLQNVDRLLKKIIRSSLSVYKLSQSECEAKQDPSDVTTAATLITDEKCLALQNKDYTSSEKIEW